MNKSAKELKQEIQLLAYQNNIVPNEFDGLLDQFISQLCKEQRNICAKRLPNKYTRLIIRNAPEPEL